VLRLDPPMLKIGSTNLTNIPLLREIGRSGVPVLISTGLGTLGETEDALAALDAAPERVGLFHCTVKYPAPMAIVNLRAITTMKSAFPRYAVGYSDHTEGETAAVAAVALGARMIEKHFTLDRTQEGPDHAFSTDPPGFAKLLAAVRDAEAALGDGIKRAAGEEAAAIRSGRRYLVTAEPIKRGQTFTPSNLMARRIPADVDGILPAMLDHIAGWQAPRDYPAGEPLSWGHFKPARNG
jgi:N,N'-diacetyllegionaminate synthase